LAEPYKDRGLRRCAAPGTTGGGSAGSIRSGGSIRAGRSSQRWELGGARRRDIPGTHWRELAGARWQELAGGLPARRGAAGSQGRAGEGARKGLPTGTRRDEAVVGDQGAWPLAREKACAAGGEVGKRPTVGARGDRRGGSVREVEDEDMWDGISRCTLFSNSAPL
jgi:hypothetical protein